MTILAEPSLDLERLLHNADRIVNRFEAYGFLLDLVRHTGFRFFALFSITPDREQTMRETTLVTNVPEGIIADFDDAQLARNSKSFKKLQASVLPFTWSAQDRVDETERGLLRRIIDTLAIDGGISLPVGNIAGSRAALLMLGKRPRPDLAESAKLSLVAHCVYERLTRALESKGSTPLSRRERECLVWTSGGKTSNEIAAILGISEHTVNQYVAAACQKLGTVNRTQAVAKAIRMRMIA